MELIKTRTELLNLIPKGSIFAELGVFIGHYSQEILHVVQPRRFYMVDVFKPGHAYSGDKDGSNRIDVPNLEEYFYRLKDYYENDSRVSIIRSTSHDFLQGIKPDVLEVIYVDADHSYNNVYQDLKLSYLKTCSNGIILGHDHDKPSVKKAVDDFCRETGLHIAYLTEDKCPSYLIYK